MDVRGKRFLITQNSLVHLAGSELVTFELARFLQESGATVVVYNYYSGEPIQKYFVDAGIRLITDSNPDLHASDFDYVWVHHQVIPQSFTLELASKQNRHHPTFIFHHMSPLPTFPIERPYIYDLENRLSSRSLFVSKGVEAAVSPLIASSVSKMLFCNPAPPEFAQYNFEPSHSLKKLLIVSNHPPREVQEMRGILRRMGVESIVLGEGGEDREPITPSLLASFDAVVTVGKTVQYCLSMGMPVYIYDIRGAAGYLDDDNFEQAAWYTFSGRNNPGQLSPMALANDIASGYGTAVEYHQLHRGEFIRLYSIDNVLPTVLDVNKKDIKPFSERYRDYVVTAQSFAQERITWAAQLDHQLLQSRDEVVRLNRRLTRYENVTNVAERLARPVRYVRKIGGYIRRRWRPS